MSPEERKEFIQIFNEGIEQVILPYFARIQEEIAGIHIELSEIKQDVAVLKQDVAVLKEEMSGVKQEIRGIKGILQDHGLRLDRIERKLNAVVVRQDEQGIEIKQLKDRLA